MVVSDHHRAIPNVVIVASGWVASASNTEIAPINQVVGTSIAMYKPAKWARLLRTKLSPLTATNTRSILNILKKGTVTAIISSQLDRKKSLKLIADKKRSTKSITNRNKMKFEEIVKISTNSLLSEKTT